MKAIQINRDSWHYKLARFGSFEPDWSNEDICTYTRAIIKALIGIALIAAVLLVIGAFASFALGDFIGWLAFLLIHGWINPFEYDTGTVGLAIISGMASVFLVPWLTYRGTKRAVNNSEVVGAMWDSLHKRMCAPIKVIR